MSDLSSPSLYFSTGPLCPSSSNVNVGGWQADECVCVCVCDWVTCFADSLPSLYVGAVLYGVSLSFYNFLSILSLGFIRGSVRPGLPKSGVSGHSHCHLLKRVKGGRT